MTEPIRFPPLEPNTKVGVYLFDSPTDLQKHLETMREHVGGEAEFVVTAVPKGQGVALEHATQRWLGVASGREQAP